MVGELLIQILLNKTVQSISPPMYYALPTKTLLAADTASGTVLQK